MPGDKFCKVLFGPKNLRAQTLKSLPCLSEAPNHKEMAFSGSGVKFDWSKSQDQILNEMLKTSDGKISSSLYLHWTEHAWSSFWSNSTRSLAEVHSVAARGLHISDDNQPAQKLLHLWSWEAADSAGELPFTSRDRHCLRPVSSRGNRLARKRFSLCECCDKEGGEEPLQSLFVPIKYLKTCVPQFHPESSLLMGTPSNSGKGGGDLGGEHRLQRWKELWSVSFIVSKCETRLLAPSSRRYWLLRNLSDQSIFYCYRSALDL